VRAPRENENRDEKHVFCMGPIQAVKLMLMYVCVADDAASDGMFAGSNIMRLVEMCESVFSWRVTS
jgi:hypothetical protein